MYIQCAKLCTLGCTKFPLLQETQVLTPQKLVEPHIKHEGHELLWRHLPYVIDEVCRVRAVVPELVDQPVAHLM